MDTLKLRVLNSKNTIVTALMKKEYIQKYENDAEKLNND
jgi:hypothetical protein